MKDHPSPQSRRAFLQTGALVAAAGIGTSLLSKRAFGADAAVPVAPATPPATPAPAPGAGTRGGAGGAGGRGGAPATSSAPIPPAPTPIVAPAGFGVAAGPYKPDWESLSNYQVPDWFRDAKFGIWAHWGPQCQPEMGDWYAQKMYQEGNAVNKFHVQKYGHPSKFGFKDVINEWKAEKWDPVALISRYKRAGAKYFAAMASHHDNLDMFNSKYQPWNSVAVGPKKDIVGGWAKATRDAGLRLSLTVHGDRAWSWMQDAQKADASGPMAGVPYDGKMTKADGKGLWWEGLDPQDLYAQYHQPGRYGWNLSGTPPLDKNYTEKFFNRVIDLIDQHHPDLLYFDDTVLPIYPSTDIGLRIAAYLYNTNLARNGKNEAVIATKGVNAQQRRALVLDVERGVTAAGEALPWQTDTCIGSWHYERKLLDQHKYKTAESVARMLVDIVSKNGNLQLSVPLPGNGALDTDELKFLDEFTVWMDMNNEGIYATRPWKVYGEGPSVTTQGPAGQFGGQRDVRSFAAQDVRFMKKGETLYAFMMAWPTDGKLNLTSLAEGSPLAPGKVERVQMLGMSEPLKFTRDATSLSIALPEQKVGNYAYGFKISGTGLV